jgi:glucose/arabinose dehydrogenase
MTDTHMHMRIPTMAARCLFPALLAVAGAAACQDAPQVAPSGETKVVVTTVAKGLEHPWSIAFLPDGNMLVTERPGRLRLVTLDGGVSEPVKGVPAVYAEGQGGLLDVVLDPHYAVNSTIYLSYAEPGENGTNGTAVARARLAGPALEGLKVIFRQQPKFDSKHHFGSRIVFDRDGNLFITTGERNSERDKAQDLATDLGKVVHITPDGGVPEGNPFVARKDALPEVWSYGHRNSQGAALDPRTGRLWEIEHGPKGGDEINLPEPGKNYGWPVVTYGREYSGGAVGEGISEKAGMEQPVHYWVPSIAPSGMAFHDGVGYPQWKDQLFVGALAAQQLVRLEVTPEGKVTHEERIAIGKRVRDVREGPDGALYLATDEDAGEILRVTPVN